MNPTPSQIQQVIEHLDSLGLIVCKKESVPERPPHVWSAQPKSMDYWEDGYTDGWNNCREAMLSAAPPYAMRNAAEKGGE